jgi:hypothetical protein
MGTSTARITRRFLDRSYVWPTVVAAAVVWQWITAPMPVAVLVTLFAFAALIAGALAANGSLRRVHAHDVEWLERYEHELDDADDLRALVDALCATKRRSPAENHAIRVLRAYVQSIDEYHERTERDGQVAA